MHKGDILPAEAYERLKANPQAVLVDVRTAPEWAYVGVPAVERLIRLSLAGLSARCRSTSIS